MYRKKTKEQQQTLWIASSEIVTTEAGTFWDKLDAALESMEFSSHVHALCERRYSADSSLGGRPGIDPVVYFKMHLVGFLRTSRANGESPRAVRTR